MKLVELNWNPTDRQLRQFGAISLFALPLIGWSWGGAPNTMFALAAIGVVIAFLGFVFPMALKPLFRALMIVATPIGMVLGEVAILLVYFGVFLPIGLALRLAGCDALRRKRDQCQASYWESKEPSSDVERYFRQF